MKTIEIIVSPQGEVRLETKGFTGPACQAASHFLREALGPVIADEKTAAYHQVSEGIHNSLGEPT